MWVLIENKLYKRFEFTNFRQAFAFMQRVAELAEQINHHPLWTNEYNVVEIWLSTHENNNQTTQKDYKLAELIDSINF
jgi:4a-hydroxytetrahydrobiopterin dehydratase